MPDSEPQPIIATTRYCAVLGHPIKHSASPTMQNAGIAQLGLNWRYLAFDTHPDHLQAAIEGARAMKFIGLNLTVPHKLLAVEMMDALDESARKWGAVNTVRFEGVDAEGNWHPLGQTTSTEFQEIRCRGFNTDADAVIRSIREDLRIELKGAKVLLLGAGGAGRVAALKLAEEQVAQLWLVNRTESKAQAIAEEARALNPGATIAAGYPDSDVDLIVNATSLGLRADDPLPLDEARFPLTRTRHVYDMIYAPARTDLLQRAQKAGCRTANGSGMLLYQGVKALEIWTGLNGPVDAMRTALNLHLAKA